jgi:hypothetical protein
MITRIDRSIPPNLNKSILISVLLPEVIRTKKYNSNTYISAITKFEIECEKRLKDLFSRIGIQSSTKSDRFSLPYKHEVIGEIEGNSYLNYAFDINKIARVFVKDLIEKNANKIRFYLLAEVVTENETIGKRYKGKVVYKFRYMIHF